MSSSIKWVEWFYACLSELSLPVYCNLNLIKVMLLTFSLSEFLISFSLLFRHRKIDKVPDLTFITKVSLKCTSSIQPTLVITPCEVVSLPNSFVPRSFELVRTCTYVHHKSHHIALEMWKTRYVVCRLERRQISLRKCLDNETNAREFLFRVPVRVHTKLFQIFFPLPETLHIFEEILRNLTDNQLLH